jgi:hypothetical protein
VSSDEGDLVSQASSPAAKSPEASSHQEAAAPLRPRKEKKVKRARSPSSSSSGSDQGEEYDVEAGARKARGSSKCIGGPKAPARKGGHHRVLPLWAVKKEGQQSKSKKAIEMDVVQKARGWARRRKGLFDREEEEIGMDVGAAGDGGSEEEGDEEMDDWLVPDDEEEEEEPTRCVCGATSGKQGVKGLGPAELLWVQCSNEDCEYWCHGVCFGIEEEAEVPKRFLCHECDSQWEAKAAARATARREGSALKKRRGKRDKELLRRHPQLELYALLEEEGRTERFLKVLRRLGFEEATRLAGPYERSGLTVLMAAARGGRVEEAAALLAGEGEVRACG